MAEILIVDDDETLLSVLDDFLRMEGYGCTTASSVAQARNHLEGKGFDLVISDFNMPRETGIDLLRYVRSECPDTAFVMMTATNDAELKRSVLEMGAQAFVSKPFKLSGFLPNVMSCTAWLCRA